MLYSVQDPKEMQAYIELIDALLITGRIAGPVKASTWGASLCF